MKKEKLLHEKLAKAKTKLQIEQKDRKNLEGRLKDSQQALQQRQEDIVALQKSLVDRDAQTRKSRTELDKVRKQRDILEQKMPTMDMNID